MCHFNISLVCMNMYIEHLVIWVDNKGPEKLISQQDD